MQDDNRIYLSDSLKDIIDFEEEKPQIKEKSNQIKVNQIYNIIETQYSNNKIILYPIEYCVKKKCIIIKSIIQKIDFNQLYTENIMIFNIMDSSKNIIKSYSCENFNIHINLKRLNENNYILKMKLKEIKHE